MASLPNSPTIPTELTDEQEQELLKEVAQKSNSWDAWSDYNTYNFDGRDQDWVNATKDKFLNWYTSGGNKLNAYLDFDDTSLKKKYAAMQDAWAQKQADNSAANKKAYNDAAKAYNNALVQLGAYSLPEGAPADTPLGAYYGQNYGDWLKEFSDYMGLNNKGGQRQAANALDVYKQLYKQYYDYLPENVKLSNETINTERDSASKAAEDQLAAERTAAANAELNAINAGIDRSKAGLLGGNSASLYSNSSNIAATERARDMQNRASTQADYLARQGQVDGMNQAAENLENSAGWAGFTGALNGAAEGATTAFTMSSDERLKEAPDGIDDDKLAEAIEQFKSLTLQLKELKGE